MILSMNEHRLIGRKYLGAVCDFFPALGINITSESRHFCGIYPNVRQPLYSQLSCSLMSDPAFWIVMGCTPSGPGVLKGLKLLITQFRFSGVKMLSVILSCFTWALEHIPARIVVSADSEPRKCVSNNRFKDSFSLSVHEPSAFVNRQDGCRLTERNFRRLEASAALSMLSQKFLQFLLLADLFCKIEGILYSLPRISLISLFLHCWTTSY